MSASLADLLELEQSIWEAVRSKDLAKVEHLFAEDYIEVTAEGKRATKDAIVETSPVVDEIDAFGLSDVTLMVLGDGAALLSYRLELSGKLRGQPIQNRLRWVTSVWRVAAGSECSGWQCCMFQQTSCSQS